MNSRTPLGQRFSKEVKPGTDKYKDYKACKSWKDKEAFRLLWAETKLQDLKKAKAS